MMLAARGIFLAARRNRKPTARSYVQDGLVAMWDGIENAGWGTHVTNVVHSGWLDLINGLRLQINPVNNPETTTSGIFTYSDNVTFRMRNMRINAIDNPKVLNVLNSVRSGFYTEQVVGQREKLLNSCLLVSTQLVNTGDTVRRSIHYYDTYNGANVFNVFNTSNNYCNLYDWPDGFDGTPCSFSFMRTLANAKLYRNGTIWMSKANNCSQTPSATQGSIILNSAQYIASAVTGSTTATSYDDIPVYCVRFYSRELTAAEIAHNYSIDKARFNLPDAT